MNLMGASETDSFIVNIRGATRDEIYAAVRSVPGPGPHLNLVWGSSRVVDDEGNAQLLVRTASADAAVDVVRDAFAANPGVEILSAAKRPPGSIDYGRYEAIRCRAVEHLVVEMMRGGAAEEERLHWLMWGWEEPITVVSVSVRGEYPDTKLHLVTYERGRDIQHETRMAIWKSEEFVAAAETIDGLRRWIGDQLMYARGG